MCESRRGRAGLLPSRGTCTSLCVARDAVQGRTSVGRSQCLTYRDTRPSLYIAGDTTARTQEVEQRRKQLPRMSGATKRWRHARPVKKLT